MKTVLSESKCFTLDERIKSASEFKNLFKNGKRASVVGAKLFYLPNGLKFNRIGFPLPRGFGNAVERNRAKRFSREVFRNLKSHLNNGYDMLLLVYPPAEKDSFHSRCEQFQTLCKKAGLFKE
ncbi:MAG: ribonuclease P protein component [Spirochaetia bacterium]|uniref:ribonuclease P protein component n=1 Tax=Treponema berlinense TaxID=225004 RepID=UPI0026F03398|nr:ribonuclease P protein component [Treponema berlinense]MDD5789430.1 ribonuclease P protein component [Spirochaetia bacterium]